MAKKSFADILGSLDATRDRKLAAKLPSWAAAGCTVPSGLSLEQCSSELTGAYKAGLIKALSIVDDENRPSTTFQTPSESPTLCDLTGGMGVDSWSFSKVCSTVHYFERDAALASAASANFARLRNAGKTNVQTSSESETLSPGPSQAISELPGIGEIIVHCETVDGGTGLPACDWVFIDPARRAADGSGKKVFLLEDCTPDVLTLLPMLWTRTERIMLKLSPMADITMVAKRLTERCREILGRPCLRSIHVVGSSGEVKELLCLLDRSWEGGWNVTAAILPHTTSPLSPNGISRTFNASAVASAEIFTFDPAEETESPADYADESDIVAGVLLYEPDPVLLKAGAFKLPCSRFGLKKLDRFTHLYVKLSPSSTPRDTKSTSTPGSTLEIPKSCLSESKDKAAGLFKIYEILEVRPFDKRSIAELGARYPAADATARNLPLTSDALRARLASSAKHSDKASSAKHSDKASDTHIFGLTVSGSRLLIAARRRD